MKAKIGFKQQELLSFAKLLHDHHHGRMQYRSGYKEHLNGFCVVRASTHDECSFEGHLCGPHQNNAKFSVWIGDEGNPLIRLKPENDLGFDYEKAFLEVIQALEIMMSRAGRYVGPISTKNWDGYYLRNTGGKKVGSTGVKNFDSAITRALVSIPFKNTCIELGFSMLKCGA